MLDGLGTHSSVTCHESNLGQGILKSDILGCLRISNIGFVIPHWLEVSKYFQVRGPEDLTLSSVGFWR